MVKKYLLYVLLFITVSASTAGIVVVTGNPGKLQNNYQQTTGKEEEPDEPPALSDKSKAMQALIEGVGKFGKTVSCSVSAEVASGSTSVAQLDFNLRLALDLEQPINTKASVAGTVSFLGGTERLELTYSDQMIYLATRAGKVRMAASSIGEIFGILSNYIPIDLSGLSDFSNLDFDALEDLLTDAAFSEKDGIQTAVLKVNPAVLLPSLQQEITLIVDLNGDGSFRSAKCSADLGNGLMLDLSADFYEDDGEIGVENSGEYQDLGFAPKLIEAVLNTVKAPSFELSGAVRLRGGVDLDVILSKCLLDVANGGRLYAELETRGAFDFSGRMQYERDTIYLDAFGKKLQISTDAIGQLLGLFGADAAESINLTEALGSLNLSDLVGYLARLGNIRYTETESGVLASFAVDLSGISGISGSARIELETRNGALAALSVSGIAFSGIDFSAELKLNLPEGSAIGRPEGNYTNLDFLPALAEAVKNTAGANGFDLSGTVRVGGAEIELSRLLIDLKQGLAVQADVAVSKPLALSGSVKYYGGSVFADLLGRKWKLADGTIAELIQMIPLPEIGGMPALDGTTISEYLAYLTGIDYEANGSGGEITLSVAGFRLTLVLSDGYLSALRVSGSGMEADLKLNRMGESVTVAAPQEQQYLDLGFAPLLLEGLTNLFAQNQFYLDASVNVRGGSGLGEKGLSARIGNVALDLSRGFSGLKFSGNLNLTGAFDLAGNLAYADGKVYVDYQGLKVRISNGAIGELLNMFGLDLSGAAGDLTQNLKFDAETVVKAFDLLKNITYTRPGGGLLLQIVLDGSALKQSKDILVSVSVSAEGRLTSVSAEGIVSGLDGSEVDFTIGFAGDPCEPVWPEDGDYADLDVLPHLVTAFNNTAALSSFGLASEFTILRGDGSVMRADPKLNIELNGNRAISKVSGSANIDTMGMNLGFWYQNGMVYANLNDLKLKLSTSSVSDLLASVMGLLGDGGGGIDDVMNTVNSVIDRLRLNRIGEIIRGIGSEVYADGSKVLSAVLNSNILYGTDAIPEDKFVTVRLAVSAEGYFTRLDVRNVVSGSDCFDFTIELMNVADGTVTDAFAEDPASPEEFIDISGLSVIIDAFSVTSRERYFHINGEVSASVIGISIKRTADIQVKVHEDGSFDARIALSFQDGVNLGFLGDTRVFHENILYYDGKLGAQSGTPLVAEYRETALKNSKRTVKDSYRMTLEEFAADPIPHVKSLIENGTLNLALDQAMKDNGAGGDEAGSTNYYKILKSMQILESGATTTVKTELSGSAITSQKVLGANLLSDFKINLDINERSEFTRIYVENLKIINLVTISANLYLKDFGTDRDTVLDYAGSAGGYRRYYAA